MDFGDISDRGLVLLGCGKMGGAMLQGWLGAGLAPTSVWASDPQPSPWLASQGIHLNADLPEAPAVIIVAVKPQMMGDALPTMARYGNANTMFLSVAAGTQIAMLERTLGTETPIVRAMPNTPAAIGKGITALIANQHANDEQQRLAETLLSAVGTTIWLEHEGQMDAVTAVSGSGPAYVFHLIETLAAAGVAEGLDPSLSLQLAKATVEGAGALAAVSDEPPSQLRVNVTSPEGTTEAALRVLMDPDTGFPNLLANAVRAAADRSRELGQ